MLGSRIGSPMAAWFDHVAKGCLPSLCLATRPAVLGGSSNLVFHFHTELFDVYIYISCMLEVICMFLWITIALRKTVATLWMLK